MSYYQQTAVSGDVRVRYLAAYLRLLAANDPGLPPAYVQLRDWLQRELALLGLGYWRCASRVAGVPRPTARPERGAEGLLAPATSALDDDLATPFSVSRGAFVLDAVDIELAGLGQVWDG